jgi:DNA-directed RNA polymerase subunit L
MKINILEYDEEEKISLEIAGEGHTFANIIREALNEVNEVFAAGYFKMHPFEEKVKIVYKATPKKKIDKAVKNATKNLTKKLDDFYKSLEKAL